MLDIRTLMAAHSAVAAVITLFALTTPLRRHLPGVRMWIMGYALFLPGLMGLALRGAIPDFLSITGSNTLIMAGLLVCLNGLRIFTSRPGFTPRQILGLSLVALAFAGSFYWYSAIVPSMVTRIYIISITLTILALASAWTLLRSDIRGSGRLFCLGSYIVYALSSMARMAIIMFRALDDNAAWTGPTTQLFVLLSMMLVVALALGFFVMVSDVLHERLERQQKILQESLNHRETLEAIIRHDLRAPLAPVVTLAGMLEKDFKLEPEAAEMVWLIKDRGLHMLDMIDTTLNLYKLENGSYRLDKTPVDLAGVLRRVKEDMRPLSAALAVALQMDLGDDPLACHGEEALLYSGLANLVRNAMEASPEHAVVQMEAMRQGPFIRIVIRNRGEVPAEIRDRIFEKYATSGKSRGKGLGAYSANLVIEAHGGSVVLDSSEPGRTTTEIMLPAD